MTPRRRKLDEGDPIVPVAQTVSTGLHERDVYIASALSSATAAWHVTQDGKFVFTANQIVARAIEIADATMANKETAT